MKRTKFTALLLAVVLVLASLAGCSKTPDEGNNNPTPSATKTPSNNNDNSNNNNNDNSNNNTVAPELTYADGTVLRMATGYNSKDTGISFSADVAGEGITLADGKTYHAGDLKPTWVTVQEKLNIKFEDKYQGNSSSKEL